MVDAANNVIYVTASGRMNPVKMIRILLDGLRNP